MAMYAEQVQFGPLKEERVTYCHRPSYNRTNTDLHSHELSAGEQTPSTQHSHGSFVREQKAMPQNSYDSLAGKHMATTHHSHVLSAGEQMATNRTSLGSPHGEHRAATQHSATYFLAPQDIKHGTEPRDTRKKSYSPPSVSQGSGIWKSSPPYISPIISPTSSFPSLMHLSPTTMMNLTAAQPSPTSSFPSFTPLSASTMMNIATQQTSPTSLRAFTPSSELSREMFSGVPSAMRFHPSPTSSPSIDSACSSAASSQDLSRTSSKSSLSPPTLSQKSSQEMTSPGLSSSRDSGFSSPSLAEEARKVVPQGASKSRPGQKKKSSTRCNFTTGQIATLQKMFEENAYPDSDVMESVAMELQMSERQVKIWFQNRRARHRRRKTGGSTLENLSGVTSIQRIYSPMTPAGYTTPVTMPMTSPYPLPGAMPMYIPTIQGQTSHETSFRPEFLRNHTVANCQQQSWNPYGQTPAAYRTVLPMNNQYPTQKSWPGMMPC